MINGKFIKPLLVLKNVPFIKINKLVILTLYC